MDIPRLRLTVERLRFFFCNLGFGLKDIESITGWSRAEINRVIREHKLRKASGLCRKLGVPEWDVITQRLGVPLSFHEGVSVRAAREELRARLLERARQDMLQFTALDLLIRDVAQMVREHEVQQREPGELVAEAADHVLRLLSYPLTDHARERLRVLHDRLHDLKQGGALGARAGDREAA